MNQENYKAIAEIIKKHNSCPCGEHEIDCNTEISLELADYFEKEDKKDYWKTHNPKYDVYVKHKFNRKQFLKDCGVEE